MKHLCLIFAIIILPSLASSQEVRDTVVVYIDNRIEIRIALEDYTELKTTDKIGQTLEDFSKLLPQFSAKLHADTPELVRYKVDSELTVAPGSPQQIYLVKEGDLSDTGIRDKAIIIDKDFQLMITTTDLMSIADMALASCMQHVGEAMAERTRWSKSLSLNVSTMW